jgi:hypothetical protein
MTNPEHPVDTMYGVLGPGSRVAFSLFHYPSSLWTVLGKFSQESSHRKVLTGKRLGKGWFGGRDPCSEFSLVGPGRTKLAEKLNKKICLAVDCAGRMPRFFFHDGRLDGKYLRRLASELAAGNPL